MRLLRALLAEALGTLLLLATVVGSGIMGVRLAQGNDGIALLANAGATAAILYVLIIVFGPTSGAHFNPAVTLAMRIRGAIDTRTAMAYVVVQIIAAIIGVALAHAMFDQALLQPGTHAREGAGQWLSEGVATFGLLLTILLGAAHRPAAVPALVGAYIFAAYWFTGSTSFANPAVTLARSLTQSFAGIRPTDVPAFMASQFAGMGLAVAVAAILARNDVEADSRGQYVGDAPTIPEDQ
jgi:glycerol uptake facilitator-like aquaporin